MKHPSRATLALFFPLCVLASALSAAPTTPDAALVHAVANPERTPKYVARDAARHPVEELTFFGLQPKMTVVEVWPGGGYWTEILAPYLKGSGRYYTAVALGEGKEENAATAALKARVDEKKDGYGTIIVTGLGKGHYDIAPSGSVDLIVTFRNLHNWMENGYAEEALKSFYTALKPGGILGIEDHRGRDDKPQDPKAKSGYVRQDYAVELARKAGFELVGSSEINANPKDTKDWPQGVWTLPPTLALGATDREKYMAIGEGDNFVLKFRKPVH